MSRLAQEIRDGELNLRADSLVRFRFMFTNDRLNIGVYRVSSIGPHSIALLRAWNAGGTTFNPLTKLTVPTEGRQFGQVDPNKPFMLAELSQDLSRVTDRVFFRVGGAKHVKNIEVVGAASHLAFECLELREIRVVG